MRNKPIDDLRKLCRDEGPKIIGGGIVEDYYEQILMELATQAFDMGRDYQRHLWRKKKRQVKP